MQYRVKWSTFLEEMKKWERDLTNSPVNNGFIVFETGHDGKGLIWGYQPPNEIMVKGSLYRLVPPGGNG